MAAHDDLPRPLDRLELLVQTGAGQLGGTHYLAVEAARELLEETAHARYAAAGPRPVFDLVAASGRFTWPDELGVVERRDVVTRLLAANSLIVSDRGDFRFADEEVEQFLAACHIVHHLPRGPRWWQPKYLAPRPNWPWSDLGVHLFLTALWWPVARAAVERRVGRLLGKRHWYPNTQFVLELYRRNLLPCADIARRAVAAVRRGLDDERLPDDRWATAVEWLHQLDPTAAVSLLDDFARLPVKAKSPERQLLAVDVLAKYDPVRSQQHLKSLPGTSTGPPDVKFKAARLIGERDATEGARAMLNLTTDEELGELRVQAAIKAGSVDRMRELVERGEGLSDEGRMELLTELLAREPTTASIAAERFAGTAVGERTPLGIAVLLLPYDLAAALQILDRVAWSANPEADSEVRLRAVERIGEFDPDQAIPALRRLSGDFTVSVTGAVRLEAAKRILVEHQGSIDALVELASHPGVSRTCRIKAAEEAGRIDNVVGARLLIGIAKPGPPADAGRVKILAIAYELDHAQAATALETLARNKIIPGRIRIQAVEIAGPTFGQALRLDLLSDISTTTEDDDPAMVAARTVLVKDTIRGRKLMASLAGRKKAGYPYRVTAALEAGSEALPALRELATTARPDALRLKAAQVLSRYDMTTAVPVLRYLARNAIPHELRIEAASSLPGRYAVDELSGIAGNRRETDTLRLQAALKITEKDVKSGLKAMRKLAEDPKLSPGVRSELRRQLG